MVAVCSASFLIKQNFREYVHFRPQYVKIQELDKSEGNSGVNPLSTTLIIS